jgi:hypothetical protein
VIPTLMPSAFHQISHSLNPLISPPICQADILWLDPQTFHWSNHPACQAELLSIDGGALQKYELKVILAELGASSSSFAFTALMMAVGMVGSFLVV